MFSNNRRNFNTSRENLITMESEESVYQDPDCFSKNQIGSKTLDSRRRQQHNCYTPQPPMMFPPKNDMAAYKVNNAKVTLHPDLNHREYNSGTRAYPMGDGRFLIRKNGGNIGSSMHNVCNTNSAETTRTHTPRTKNEAVSDPSHHYNSKVDSCCHSCCFFLLYTLIIAVGLTLYYLHMHFYYPHIINQYSELNKTVATIKEDVAISRHFLKMYCTDYYTKTYNQSFAKKKCKKSINSDRFVSDSPDNSDDTEIN